MTKEQFYQEVNNLVEDYIHNNYSKPKFLLINSKTLQNLFDEYDNFVGLMIVLSYKTNWTVGPTKKATPYKR